MSTKAVLKIIFFCILLSLLICTVWAASQQSVLAWGGLRGPDGPWTIATLMDAYCGFLTFYVWVFFKESRASARIAWFAGIMLLGNMAMSVYVLLQLARLRRGEEVSAILIPSGRRAPPGPARTP